MSIIEMQVHIDCAGCENKIRKSLEKLKGVESVDIDMGLQKVTVTGYADEKKVLKRVRRTGRRAEIWTVPYNPDIRTDNYNPNQQQGGSAAATPSAVFYTRQPSGASLYNYYKHGYDDTTNHARNYQAHSSAIFGHQTTATFSDENTQACFIM